MVVDVRDVDFEWREVCRRERRLALAAAEQEQDGGAERNVRAGGILGWHRGGVVRVAQVRATPRLAEDQLLWAKS
jgi:hypothetical protein